MTNPFRSAAAVGTLMTLLGLGWLGAVYRSSAWDVPTIRGRRPPQSADQWSAWVDDQATHAEQRDVLLDAPDGYTPIPRVQLGLSADRTEARMRLTSAAIELGFGQRLAKALGSLGYSPPPPERDLSFGWRLDPARARVFLDAFAERVNIQPRDAEVDYARHRAVAATPGRRLDVERTLSDWARSTRESVEILPLHFTSLAPNVELSQLTTVDPRKVLSVFQTDFSKKRGPRIANIRRAAQLLDGAVLEPGATLSFNARVGPRIASRGFVDAPVIVNDEMESGMGGGVCQVATTLHGAAVYGGLEVVERRSHSRPSGYASLGLDATVIDGVQDLKLRNVHSVPVYVRAYLPSRYVVRVELLGAELDGQVKHSYRVLGRHPYSRRLVEKPDLAPGTFTVSQKGGYGYDTLSSVVITASDGQRRERRYKSKYYPVPEVLWIGPGTRPTDLPPSPEEAGEQSPL